MKVCHSKAQKVLLNGYLVTGKFQKKIARMFPNCVFISFHSDQYGPMDSGMYDSYLATNCTNELLTKKKE